jgi:hypothetical protein
MILSKEALLFKAFFILKSNGPFIVSIVTPKNVVFSISLSNSSFSENFSFFEVRLVLVEKVV